MLITPGFRQIFHLLTDLLTHSFISIVDCGKIFPKKEKKNQSCRFCLADYKSERSCDLLHSLLRYSYFKLKICKSVAFKIVFWVFLAE